MTEALKRLIQAAQQLEEADLIIQNGTVVDVFSLETFEADVAIRDGRIVGIGTCLLYTSPSPRDRTRSRMPSSA